MSNDFDTQLVKKILDPQGIIKSGIKLALELNIKNSSGLGEIRADITKLVTICELVSTCDYISINVEITNKYPEIITESNGTLCHYPIEFLSTYPPEYHKCVLLLMAYILSKILEEKQNPSKKTIKAIAKSTQEHLVTAFVETTIEKIFFPRG